MSSVLFEIVLIIVLLIGNGVFAMTEIAIVSSRRGLLQSMADGGNKGAAKALTLAENPNRFLSTVQIGITLVGIVAGAFGGASIATRLTEVLEPLPVVGPFAAGLSFVIVIGLITFFSLVIGELVPKRLAMRYPEPIASTMAGPMAWLAWIGTPVVALLSMSTSGLLRLVGVKESEESRMSREEFTVLVREGLVTGSIDKTESKMMEGVFDFETLEVYDIMIPRPKLVWIEQDSLHADVWRAIMRSTQSVFPVYQGNRDNIVGAVSLRDIYGSVANGGEISFKDLMRPPLLVPEAQKASALLESFRSTGQRAAFVLDEFGGVMGMVTLIDLMESIIGDVHSKEEQLAMPIRRREDGTWLIDGLFEIEKLANHLEGFVTPDGAGDDYQTLAGWFSRKLSRVPSEGDKIEDGEWSFEIIDMDGIRVDKVLAQRREPMAIPV